MRTVLGNADVLRELERVQEQLASPRLTGEKRLVLTAAPAQLGDLRDAHRQRARQEQK